MLTNVPKFASTLPKPHKPIRKTNALSKSLQKKDWFQNFSPTRRHNKIFQHRIKKKYFNNQILTMFDLQ
jgi:hypothetical protein